MASGQQRRRRGQQSPTTMIVNFFLDAPIETAKGALELAQALIARRIGERREADRVIEKVWVPPPPPIIVQVDPANVRPRTEAENIALGLPATPAPAQPRAPRRKRSDAGQPRGKRGVAAAAETSAPVAAASEIAIPPKRRGRPPVSDAVAAVAALPELPPQDVPYEARVDEPVEVG